MCVCVCERWSTHGSWAADGAASEEMEREGARKRRRDEYGAHHNSGQGNKARKAAKKAREKDKRQREASGAGEDATEG